MNHIHFGPNASKADLASLGVHRVIPDGTPRAFRALRGVDGNLLRSMAVVLFAVAVATAGAILGGAEVECISEQWWYGSADRPPAPELPPPVAIGGGYPADIPAAAP